MCVGSWTGLPCNKPSKTAKSRVLFNADLRLLGALNHAGHLPSEEVFRERLRLDPPVLPN